MPACPFCGSADTVREAAFGTSLMVARHWCRACRSCFENIKWGDEAAALDLPAFLRRAPAPDPAPPERS